MNKTIICLANSRKNAAHCIAGKDAESKCWIRPVSDRSSHEITNGQCRYRDGKMPQPFDIMSIPVKELSADGHQPENMLIDETIRWEKVGAIQYSDLRSLIDNGPLPWANNYSTNGKCNDRVPTTLLNPEQGSLRLVFADLVTLKVQSRTFSGSSMEKKTLHADFLHYGTQYCIDVTDPIFEQRYLHLGIGEYTITNAYLCISLGVIFGPFAYKLAAAIFTGD